MAALIPGAFFGLAGMASKLLGKKPQAPSPPPMPTRNAAAEAAMQSDQVAKRRGVAANMLLGGAGAESGAGKTSLGT